MQSDFDKDKWKEADQAGCSFDSWGGCNEGTEPRQKEKEGDDQYLGARIVGPDIGLDVDLNEREKSQMAPEFLPQH